MVPVAFEFHVSRHSRTGVVLVSVAFRAVGSCLFGVHLSIVQLYFTSVTARVRESGTDRGPLSTHTCRWSARNRVAASGLTAAVRCGKVPGAATSKSPNIVAPSRAHASSLTLEQLQLESWISYGRMNASESSQLAVTLPKSFATSTFARLITALFPRKLGLLG